MALEVDILGMEIRINIQKKHLFFRKDAQAILRRVLTNKKAPLNVYLDFSNVAFFSRSFVDEFLNIIDELKERKISVAIHHLNPRLEMMMSHIRKTKTEIQKAMA